MPVFETIAASVAVKVAGAVGQSLTQKVLEDPLALAASQITEKQLSSFWDKIEADDLIYTLLVDIKREFWEESPWAGGKTAGYLGEVMKSSGFSPLAQYYVKFGVYKAFDGSKGAAAYLNLIEAEKKKISSPTEQLDAVPESGTPKAAQLIAQWKSDGAVESLASQKLPESSLNAIAATAAKDGQIMAGTKALLLINGQYPAVAQKYVDVAGGSLDAKSYAELSALGFARKERQQAEQARREDWANRNKDKGPQWLWDNASAAAIPKTWLSVWIDARFDNFSPVQDNQSGLVLAAAAAAALLWSTGK